MTCAFRRWPTRKANCTAGKRAEQAEQAALQREMNLARDIQMSLLPRAAPDIPNVEIGGQCLPARQVGGDLYAYYTLLPTASARGGYGLAIGDVTGKGIPAALYMTATVMALSAKAPFEPDVARLLSELNATLHPYMSLNRMNVALCYVRLALADGGGHVAHIANAGMVAPILRRGARCEYLDIGGLPLGALDTVAYRALELPMQGGDMLILCSDGVVENMNTAREMYGLERLKARAAAGPAAAQEMIEWIISDAQAFAGDAEQNDDMTIIVVKERGNDLSQRTAR